MSIKKSDILEHCVINLKKIFKSTEMEKEPYIQMHFSPYDYLRAQKMPHLFCCIRRQRITCHNFNHFLK